MLFTATIWLSRHTYVTLLLAVLMTGQLCHLVFERLTLTWTNDFNWCIYVRNVVADFPPWRTDPSFERFLWMLLPLASFDTDMRGLRLCSLRHSFLWLHYHGWLIHHAQIDRLNSFQWKDLCPVLRHLNFRILNGLAGPSFTSLIWGLGLFAVAILWVSSTCRLLR